MKRPLSFLILAAAAGGAPVAAAEATAGFVPLFNGRDLAGWVNANCAPETWSVREGVIYCTGKPTGALRTARQYENFILEVEWRHLSRGGNSGVFIWGTPIAAPGVPFLRGIEVQVLDHGYVEQYEKQTGKKADWFTSHGDVFPIHGGTMKPFGRHHDMRSFPSEDRSKPTPEWNHYRIECNDGTLRLSVNGKEVSGGSECNYRKGYLALESEGAPVEFRNIRIKELPATNALPEFTAPIDQGWRALFNGLDLRGWRTDANRTVPACWSVRGERLMVEAQNSSNCAVLWTEEAFGDAEFILDCQPAKSAAGEEAAAQVVRFTAGEGKVPVTVPLASAQSGRWQRFSITVQGRDVIVRLGGTETHRLTLPPETPGRRPFGLGVVKGAALFMNLYARDLGAGTR